MITMFDTITIQEVPSFANSDRDAVAGYVDGYWPTAQRIFAQLPQAHHLSITVNAEEVADCLDIENGDAIPGQASEWWHKATMAGIWRPCLYSSLDNMNDVFDNLSRAGIHRTSYRLWAAHYTGQPHIEKGCDATQWTDHALGRNLDESLCLSTFFRDRVVIRKARNRHVLDRISATQLEELRRDLAATVKVAALL